MTALSRTFTALDKEEADALMAEYHAVDVNPFIQSNMPLTHKVPQSLQNSKTQDAPKSATRAPGGGTAHQKDKTNLINRLFN